ncbi:MAG: hypothetical protein V4699_03130 [Patescibacteria group bacterium]
MESPKFNTPPIRDAKNQTTETIKKFHPSLGFEQRNSFHGIVDKLPDSIKGAFLEFLKWRSVPISPMDYNLACTFRDYSFNKSGGDKTDALLCESIKEAMELSTGVKVFRKYFDTAWNKRVALLKSEAQNEVEKKKAEMLAKTFQERKEAGQTYTGNPKGLGVKGWIHRKPGHS